MRKDPRIWAAVAVSAIAFAAGTAWGARGPTSAAAARAAAQRLLEMVTLPAGATRSPTNPATALLDGPAAHPATPNLVDAHSFWRVPGDPSTVYDWIRAHPPAGSALSMTGALMQNGSTQLQYAGFSFLRPRQGRAPTETLLLTVAAARGGGTAVRADGQVVWLLVRPVSERVPPGVHAITVSERLGSQSRGPWVVTDRARVKRAAAIIDALPVTQPGVTASARAARPAAVACPADLGTFVTLKFETAARNGSTLASAYVDGGGCGGVQFWIHGRAQHALQGTPNLVRDLSSALGIRF